MESKANTPRLSPREFDVFNLLIEGKRVKAKQRFISDAFSDVSNIYHFSESRN